MCFGNGGQGHCQAKWWRSFKKNSHGVSEIDHYLDVFLILIRIPIPASLNEYMNMPLKIGACTQPTLTSIYGLGKTCWAVASKLTDAH